MPGKKTKNQAKLYPKNKSLNLKSALIFAVVFGVVGLAFLIRSFAATGALHEYTYNSPGIKHNVGFANVVQTTSGQVTVWAVYGNCDPGGAGCINGSSMWFGPYYDIADGNNHVLQACWTYLPPVSHSYTVIFDVIYTNSTGHHWLYNVGQNKKTISPSARISNTLYVPQRFCTNIQLGDKPYPNLEVRVRPVSASYGNDNSVKIWKTSWQIVQ